MNFTGDGDCFKERFVDSDLDGAIPPQAIGDENGGIYHRVDETMLIGYRQMGDGFISRSGIKGVGICEKGFPFIASHLFHDSPDEEGTDKRGVSFLPKMEFDRHQVLFSDLPFQISAAQQNVQFNKRFFSRTPEISEKDLALHVSTPFTSILIGSLNPIQLRIPNEHLKF